MAVVVNARHHVSQHVRHLVQLVISTCLLYTSVPTISEFVSQCASAADHIYRVAFDGRTVSASFGERLSKIKNVEIEDTFYAGDYIWQSREAVSYTHLKAISYR